MSDVDSAMPARARISKSAFLANLDVARATGDVMTIVKADAYGHGLDIIAPWARDAGVNWFGAAQLDEALRLRAIVGACPRILTWIYAPGAPLKRAIEADIDLSIGALWAIDEVAGAARHTGRPARVHVKVDTGMARGGFSPADFVKALPRLRELVADGAIELVGLWSHLACADDPDPAVTNTQTARFEEARAAMRGAGLTPQLCHLAASGGNLWHPATHYDLTRPGIMLLGLSPNHDRASAEELGLRAVMQLEADVIVTRQVPAGTGVSYGHTERMEQAGKLAVVPLGYGDGIPRAASSSAHVHLGGERAKIMGRVCMDQFVVAAEATPGHTAVLFGDAATGYPTAEDWARAAGTIGYEIVTRIGARVPRVTAP